MKLRGAGVYIGTSVLALGAACSSSSVASQIASGDCPSVGEKNCPGDAEVTQDDVNQCNSARTGTCGSAYIAYLECVGKSAGSCDANGKTLSTGATTCASEEQTYLSCTSN